MTLLDEVSAHLDRRHVAHALIGASALAAHGVSRSTVDLDLLVTDLAALEPSFWTLPPDVAVDARRGDADDPLAGVVRLTRGTERGVDVVVGRHAWQSAILDRALPIPGQSIRLVEAADLVLLKLYAGGSQDRWDIEQLLALDANGAVAATISARVGVLPLRSRDLWDQLRRSR